MGDGLLLATSMTDEKTKDPMPPTGGGEWPHERREQNISSRRAHGLVISSFDKQRLIRLISAHQTTVLHREDLEDLAREIERGIEAVPEQMPPDVVTMNSTVRVTELKSGTSHVYTIVYPADADYERGRISILAPLGTALLGYRVGDVVDWHMPGGLRKLRIDEMIYQPESAGDFQR